MIALTRWSYGELYPLVTLLGTGASIIKGRDILNTEFVLFNTLYFKVYVLFFRKERSPL